MDTKLLIDFGKQALMFVDQNFMTTVGVITATGIMIKIIKEKLIEPRNYYVLYPRIKKMKRYKKFLNKVD